MAYSFIRTFHGPAVLGDDEVLYFNEHQLLVDYVDEDPDFVKKAKEFLISEIQSQSGTLVDSFTTQVVGGDPIQPMFGLLNAIRALSQFEFQFLPNVYRK